MKSRDKRQRSPSGKYRDGERFMSIQDLCDWIVSGKNLRVSGRTRNATFARNQQLNTLLGWLSSGVVCRAELAPTNPTQLRDRLRRELAEVEEYLEKEDIPW